MDTGPVTVRSSRLAIAALVVALIALVVAALALVDDDEDAAPAPSPSTNVSTNASTTSTTEATTTTRTEVDPASAVFPDATTSRRFDDPAAATRAFATELLRFNAPLVGELRAGDGRSGEIDVRAFEGGVATTVLVRQVEDGTWFILGAVAESIRLEVPEAGDRLLSPHSLRGEAHAFEGNVVVHLYADGLAEPIGEAFVTGRGDGELGEFSGTISFEVPDGATSGVLVLFEPSAQDGSTVAATVVRVHF